MKKLLIVIFTFLSMNLFAQINVKKDSFRKIDGFVMLDKYEHISKIKQWWESIPLAFEITSVGKVLAHTNAKRCDSNIPNWEL